MLSDPVTEDRSPPPGNPPAELSSRSTDACSLLSSEPAVFGFLHVATHGQWRRIVADQIALLHTSGLYARSTRIFIGIVGDDAQHFNPDDDKIDVVYRSSELREFEFPTLRLLKQHCATHDGLIFYLHTKGVFRDTAATNDWREYMQYFAIERHRDCIQALQTYDVCGVNWIREPWPHFSGNFWWAASAYVRRLPDIDSLEAVEYFDHDRRHICERWIGTDTTVRAASLHQSHIDHYDSSYPRELYAGTKPADFNEAMPYPNEPPPNIDSQRSWLDRSSGPVPGSKPLRVAMIFDTSHRPDTTGFYCVRAMWHIAIVAHFLPQELAYIPPGSFDLYLYIDDGLDYALRSDLHPSAMWAIDTHLNPARLLRRAAGIDAVFAAQRDGVALLRRHGINCVGWLPLACDPEIHCPRGGEPSLDICFVGHLSTPHRVHLASRLSEAFPNSFVGQRFFEEMAETYSQSRIVLNSSVRNDVNMRVFEALACGGMLLTNDVRSNGLDELFAEGRHLITYKDHPDLEEKTAYYLDRPELREKIARAGRSEAIARHTYLQRMKTIVAIMAETNAPAPTAPQEVGAQQLTTIVIVTFNAIHYTKLCLESISASADEPIEIVVVDNGSSDGTPEFVRTRSKIRLIENRVNRGFATAANQGIRASSGGRIVLLNNDVVVTPGWLGRLHAALDRSRDIGLAGPCSNCVSGDQQISADYPGIESLNAFAATWSRKRADELCEVDRLVGFCLMFRRELVDEIGLLDERFEVGNFEDDDFCHRARLAGYRAVIARGCFVHHFGSVTFKENGINYAAVIDENRRRFFEKWQDSPASTGAGTSGPRPKLSVCLIVRDNQRTLRPCLQSIRPWVDEIVVVDTGSADETPAIAAECGAQVSRFPWCDDFAAARNRSFEAARGEWLFWMDSDDTIDDSNGQRLRDIANGVHDPATMGFVMQVRCPAGAEALAAGYATDTVVDHIKLVRNHPGIRFEGRIHEQILPSIRRLGGDVQWADVAVVHSGSDSSAAGRTAKHERDLRLLKLELRDKPDDTFALFNLGMTLLDAQRPDEALAVLCHSLQVATPGESHIRKIHAFLVQAYCELGRTETALKTCRRGLDAYPDDPELLFRSASLQQTLGLLDEAERSFLQLLETPRPQRHFSSIDGGILGVKAWHNLAVLYDQQRRSIEAARAWERVLAFDARNLFAWRSLLEALSESRDIAGLQRAMERSQATDVPWEAKAMVRSRAMIQASAPDRAIDELQSIALQPESPIEVLSELCEIAFTNGRLETAEAALVELTRRIPNDASARLNLASVYFQRADFVRAAEWAQRSLAVRPGHPFAHHIWDEARLLGRRAKEIGAQPAVTEDHAPAFEREEDLEASNAAVDGRRENSDDMRARPFIEAF